MSGARWTIFAVFGASMTACAGAPARPPALMEGKGTEDIVRLTNGEVVKGRILEENSRSVVIERDERVTTLPRAAVYSIDYSRESWKERNAALRPSEPAAEGPRPSTSWYARAHPAEQVEQTEVLWFDVHPLDECVGSVLAKAHADLPDLALFVEAGGKVQVQDPRRWGYHAHGFPGGFHRPATSPGLSIDIPKRDTELPSALAFVSPSQEMKSPDSQRGSYTPPDAIYAAVKPLAAAEGILAVQPFTGGRPTQTRNGTLWAFSLPRNSRQFYLCLLDPGKRHGETLKAAFAGYGDTILAPDLLIDSVAADGTVVGRTLVLPYPDGISADGPAAEPVTVYAGPTQDPARVAATALPPRLSLQLPTRACSTKASVLLSHFDVSSNVPQSGVTAWSTGRPSTGDVHLAAKDLTAKDADQLVKLDVSGLGEERFPAVAWFYHRRSYAWKWTGGYLPPAGAGALQVATSVKLTKVKRSEPIPHVLPILFTGPKGEIAQASVGAPPALASGGMSTSLMADAFAREAGGTAINALTSNLESPAPVVGPAGQGVSSVTNVYITSPMHMPAEGASLSGLSSRTSPAGMYMSQTPGWNGGPTSNPWGLGAFGPVGTERSGVYRDYRGNVIYDSATGGSTFQQSGIGSMGVDPITHNPTVTITRRNR